MNFIPKPLREHPSVIDLIFNAAHDGMALIASENLGVFRYVLVNKAFRRFLGMSDEFIVGKTPFEIFSPEDAWTIAESYRACLRARTAIEMEETVSTLHGKMNFSTILHPFYEADGTSYIIVSKKNITQQKNSERLLRDRQRLEAIMSGTPNTVISVDNTLTITFINRCVAPYTPDQVVGTSLLLYIAEVEQADVISTIQAVFDGSAEESYRVTGVDDLGQPMYYKTRVVPLSKNGRINEALLIADDITVELHQQQELSRWAEIFRTAGWGIVSGNPDGVTFDLINPHFAQMHGYTVEEVKKLHIKDLFASTAQLTLAEDIRKIHENGHHIFESVHVRKDGTEFPVLVDGTAVKGPDGEILYRSVSVQDITQLKSAEKRLAEERALLMTTLHSIGDGVISTDAYSRIVMLNAVAEALTGWTTAEAVGQPFERVFSIFNEVTGVRVESPATQAMNGNKIILLGNHTLLVRKDGTPVPIEDSAAPIKDENGTIIGAVVVFRDYSEKKEKLERIEYLSFHDQLTGLYNRRYFDEELLRLDVPRNYPISVIMLDVNGLKLTNDAFGHAVGDQLLKNVAFILKNVFRQDEIVARIGGDEFVVLLPRTDATNVENIGKRIYAELEQTRIGKVVISVSEGHATKTTQTERLDDIIKTAEEMMYHKKITESQSMRNDTVKIILRTLNETNERERIHSERVSEIATRIGRAANLDSETVKYLGLAGLLHDIGKIAVSKHLLEKPGHLTAEEREEVRHHLEVGYQILKSVNQYTNLADAVLSHHERWDGQGYPRGLSGHDIPLAARIISLADAFEAITANRPYRNAQSIEYAIEEIKKHAGTQFDPDLIDICEREEWHILDELYNLEPPEIDE